jgi:hypothetical protein
MSDFRGRRHVMDQEDFAYAPDPLPPPTDLISHDAWQSITLYPCDVSICTSSYQGSLVHQIDELWGLWIQATPTEDKLWRVPLLDAADEFQAATFNLLHGFYRQAIACLRSALETAAVASALIGAGRADELSEWQNGSKEIGFKAAREQLASLPRIQAVETAVAAASATRGLPSLSGPDGWTGRLYWELCKYTHSRPGHTTASLWQGSNGPIYVPESVEYAVKLWRFVFATCCVLLWVSVPTLSFPDAIGDFFARGAEWVGDVPAASWEALAGKNQNTDASR